MTTATRARWAGGRSRTWGGVARFAAAVLVAGCVLSSIGIGIGVDHNADDDVAGLAFLAVFVAYVPAACLVGLSLLAGVVRKLRAPALVLLAVTDLGLTLLWLYAVWPGDPACLMGCGSAGQHGVIPTATTVLLWATAVLHAAAALVFLLRLTRR